MSKTPADSENAKDEYGVVIEQTAVQAGRTNCNGATLYGTKGLFFRLRNA